MSLCAHRAHNALTMGVNMHGEQACRIPFVRTPRRAASTHTAHKCTCVDDDGGGANFSLQMARARWANNVLSRLLQGDRAYIVALAFAFFLCPRHYKRALLFFQRSIRVLACAYHERKLQEGLFSMPCTEHTFCAQSTLYNCRPSGARVREESCE